VFRSSPSIYCTLAHIGTLACIIASCAFNKTHINRRLYSDNVINFLIRTILYEHKAYVNTRSFRLDDKRTLLDMQRTTITAVKKRTEISVKNALANTSAVKF